MKIDLGKKWARKALKATETLIDYYKNNREEDCPLCLLYLETTKASKGCCKECPWTVFKRKACTDEPHFRRTSERKRLPRLYGWRKRLNNIIDRRL